MVLRDSVGVVRYISYNVRLVNYLPVGNYFLSIPVVLLKIRGTLGSLGAYRSRMFRQLMSVWRMVCVISSSQEYR